jgi:adenine-specific DNA-methyltransferase
MHTLPHKDFKTEFLKLFQCDNLDFEVGINKLLIFKKQTIENYINSLSQLNIPEDTMNEIYYYLQEFFSKYYRKGFFYDHINRIIPYSGEQIFLQWVNTDQYYVKSLNIFSSSGKDSLQDYFIHKDLKGSLKRELDFYTSNKILGFGDINELEMETIQISVKKARNFNKIAVQIIELLNQIEIFQLKLWKKKAFVLKTDYVITLDKIEEYSGKDFLKSIESQILSNEKQLKEWVELFKINVGDNPELIEQTGKQRSLVKSLPIDTKYFKNEFKWNLISALSRNNNLDEILDGMLIRSDNFKALNLVMKKYGKKVKLIYLDPPFNTGRDKTLYRNDYLDSSWLTMMLNRLMQAKDILNSNGTIFIRIDNNQNHYIRSLLDMVFGKSNFRNEIIINKTRAKQQRKKPFIQQTESLFFYSVTDNYFFNQVELPRKEPKWYELLDFPRSNQIPRIVLGKEYYPPKNRRWGLSQERINQFERKGKIRINKDKSYIDCLGNTINEKPELYYDVEPVRNDWLDIPGYSQVHKFSTENSEELLQRVIESGSKERDTVLDFFLGSGTTVATAHKLNRKWVGVEIGNQFEDFVLPRMKNVLKGEKSGISKNNDINKSGFFKYHYIEQFEDSLENAVIELPKNKEKPQIDEIEDPFIYPYKIVEKDKNKVINVDLIESFNYFAGIFVERVNHIKNNGRIYIIITGKVDKVQVAVVWRDITNIDLELDKKIIEENLKNGNVDFLFVNGNCLIKSAKSIEAELSRLI